MTTCITVKALCDPKTKKVEVTIVHMNTNEQSPLVYLESGESREFVIYDDLMLGVREILK